MEQSVERLGPEDLASGDARRNWVRGHFAPEARHKISRPTNTSAPGSLTIGAWGSSRNPSSAERIF